MKPYLKIILLLLTFPVTLNAQNLDKTLHTNKTVAALKIGDILPDIVLENILNHTRSTESLTELTKGKILIIDFFATWCGPCVKSLPRLDSLQKQYKDQIVILPVSYEDPKIIGHFLATSMKNLSMPVIAGDIKLHELFPHRIIPHDVVVNKDSYYISTTFPDELTEDAINNLIKGSTAGIAQTSDDLTFNGWKPLLVNGNGGSDSDFMYRSMLTHYKEGIHSGANYGVDTAGNYYRILSTNEYPIGLFIEAFGKGVYSVINRKRLIVDIPDSASYFPVRPFSAYYKWAPYNDYCYELILPKALPASSFFEYMFDDLNRFFSIKGTRQKRIKDCWIIKKIANGSQLFPSKGGELSAPYTGHMRNLPLKALVSFLNAYRDIEDVIDETNIPYRVDLDLPFALSNSQKKYPDILAVKADLNKYGLDIQKEKREVEVLVISRK